MSESRTLTQEELLAEATALFGTEPMDWAFRCPACGDTANGHDFKEALAANPRENKGGTPVLPTDRIGQECIGRSLGVLAREVTYTGRGCDWVAYGLFGGPWTVVLPTGKTMSCFPLASTVSTS